MHNHLSPPLSPQKKNTNQLTKKSIRRVLISESPKLVVKVEAKGRILKKNMPDMYILP